MKACHIILDCKKRCFCFLSVYMQATNENPKIAVPHFNCDFGDFRFQCQNKMPKIGVPPAGSKKAPKIRRVQTTKIAMYRWGLRFFFRKKIQKKQNSPTVHTGLKSVRIFQIGVTVGEFVISFFGKPKFPTVHAM